MKKVFPYIKIPIAHFTTETAYARSCFGYEFYARVRT